MKEQNSPIDIDSELLEQYRDDTINLLSSYDFRGKSRSFPELMRQLEPLDHDVMGPLEREAYLGIRTGMQVFTGVSTMLEEKTGLRDLLIDTKLDRGERETKIMGLRDFCNTFATYAASTYISHAIGKSLRAEEVEESKEEYDLRLITDKPKAVSANMLLAPLYHDLVQHAEHKDGEPTLYTQSWEFPQFAKEIFSQYATMAKEKADSFGELNQHINGYSWRILEDINLNGWENATLEEPTTSGKISFQPISPNEIVGNRDAKRKLTRYAERLCLYDPIEQMNPILELGGLSWTNLFDGLPGTGKSSMFRMVMTQVKERCEQIDMPYYFFFTDPSIKDEFYGKTGKILLARYEPSNNPNQVSVGIHDDIDLITSTRNDASGADNDITNIMMQFFDGALTVRRGNVINFAASNKPTGLDEALRNRMNDRILVDGPVTAEDFADMGVIIGGKLMENGLIQIENGYTPFATQDMKGENGWTAKEVASYAADQFEDKKNATLMDFGRFMLSLKDKNPSITGRSTKSIIEAIKDRTADFDVPSEWFENRELFLDKPYAEKKEILRDLYHSITPEVLYEEAQRYFDSEQRYSTADASEAIERGYNSKVWNLQSDIKLLEEQLKGKVSESLIIKKRLLNNKLNAILDLEERRQSQ